MRLVELNALQFVLKEHFMKDNLFPLHINAFKYVSRINIKGQTGYEYAVYKDSRGKKYFAKGYEGNKYSTRRLLLEKEVTFANYAKQYSIDFILPVVATFRWKFGLIVLFPYVHGKELFAYSKSYRKRILPKALDSIRSIASFTTSLDTVPSAWRPGWMLVCLFPLLFLKSLFAFPAVSLLIVLNTIVAFRGLVYLWKEPATYIAHRDFNPHNLLKTSKKMFIIDWCYVARTVKNYDVLYLLITHWDDLVIRNMYLELIMHSYYHRALGIIIATTILTDTRISQRTQKSVIAFLMFLLEKKCVGIYPRATFFHLLEVVASEILGIKSKIATVPPKRIGQYYYEKDLSMQEDLNIVTCLYSSKSGKKVIGKFWFGKIKNRGFISIIKEIKILTILHSSLLENKTRILVLFPKVVSTIQNHTMIGYLQEYIEGRKLSDVKSVKTYLKVYDDTVRFFKELSNALTVEQKDTIGNLTMVHVLLKLPLKIVQVCIKYPNQTGYFIWAYLKVIYYSKQVVNAKAQTLTHGDLHGDNVLLNDKRIFVIDVEQMRMTYAWYEYITTISSRKTPVDVSSVLSKRLNVAIKKYNIGKYLSVLLIHNSISNLSNSLPRKSMNRQTILLKRGFKFAQRL